MELHRLGVKFFAEDRGAVALPEFIPVFHRWIQQRVLDELLLDVADYSHVHAGPGIVLIAHEGNYAMDEGGGRRGLAYYAKHPQPGEIEDRLRAVCRKALCACRLLEQEPALAGRMKFGGDLLQVFANDRLNAPNTEATAAELKPAIDRLLATLYPGAGFDLERESDPKERFCVTVKVHGGASLEKLLTNLTAP